MSHGTVGGYRNGCRCDDCKEAKAAARRRYQRAKAPAGSAPGINLTAGGGYTVSATCKACGGDLEHEAAGRPTDGGGEVRATARCTRNGCRRRWLFVVGMYPFHAEDAAA